MRTITLGAVLALAATSVAAEGLPGTVTWTAYDTGSSGYNQAVAIGAAMQEAAGTNLRILPGKNGSEPSNNHRKSTQGRLDLHIYPFIGDLPVGEVTIHHMLDIFGADRGYGQHPE